ncbi:MAG: hypothetical protein GX321_01580 [Clostridiales bacterium]|nr:hypothetical protein [Clostridiales bacterium]
MTHKKVKYNLFAIVMIASLSLIIGLSTNKLGSANAAKDDYEKVDLRIIGTTDLHGQLNSFDYEKGVDYNNGGLARVFDLINKTRAELPEGNTLTLDAGDVLFDYTTEYIFSTNQGATQPIYLAMKQVGYDAITLGNHDFDYGYDYILRQLDESGLRDITVVSNVTDARTGEHPFLENMLLTRKVTSRDGKEIEIKIGIIGHTIPTLTSKTHSYAGILVTEDMIENAQKQAAILKEEGADIIIALSHTGIGPENPETNFKNVAYALTKIPEIDVVVCGHEHNLFPTNDMTSPYFKLPGVNKESYLMNGKNVVMAGDRGKAIGVVDLEIEINDDKVKIVNRKSELRMVNEKSTSEDKSISAIFGEWEDELKDYATDILGELKGDTIIQNYYGLLADNAAIQLLNDSKINYTLKQIKGDKKYMDYPIIAASTYDTYGVKSIYDFVNIKDKITESDLATLQNYNSYLYVYYINGAQLKEWLEWSASAYETTSRNTYWEDDTMSSLMKQTGLKSLISEEWLNDWSNFYIFDGISYDIDISRFPRYDFSGNFINNDRRVSNVTYQGKEVTDDMEFLIATNKITKPTDANKGVENQTVLKGFVRSQSILGKYIKELSSSGSIMPQVDYNWKLILPTGYEFIVKVPYYAGTLFEETPWYVDELIQKNEYKYYIASYPASNKDTSAPHIVIAPLVTNPTASSFEIAVQAVDDSKIKRLKYANDDTDVSNAVWAVENDIPSKGFTVHNNGIYTVFAEDIHGNKAVKRIVIDNFSDNLLAKPTFEFYTNRKSNIKGEAEPNTILVIETPTKDYEINIGPTGKFSYPLPGQLADTTINIYIKDEERGLESERVPVRINRTGPNQPHVNPVSNNMNYIVGNAYDDITSVVAIIDDLVYVSNDGGRELFEANKEIYDPSLKIVETIVDVSPEGQFVLILPPQLPGTSIKVYAMDHISRNSRVSTVTVSMKAPNMPVVYDVSNIEKSIRGYVPEASGNLYNIELRIGDNYYTTMTDKEGNFVLEFEDQLYANQELIVVAYDIKDNKERNSFPLQVVVKDIEFYVRPDSTNLTLNRVTDKSNLISGYYYSSGDVYLAIAKGEGTEFTNNLYKISTNEMHRYQYRLEKNLEVGHKIYIMTRFENGKILMARSFTVVAGRPDMPMLLNEITNTDKEVKVLAIKDCEVTLIIGKKTYKTTEFEYDETIGAYVYTFATDRDQSGTSVTVLASNDSGTSDPYVSQLIKVSPDSPKVNPIYEKDEVITGTIELLDYNPPLEERDEEEEEVKTPKEFKNAPSKVAKTQTRVYAQIGSKKYKGTIDNKGKFTIEIPAQQEGTAIKLWGTNKAGRGPLIKVIVNK